MDCIKIGLFGAVVNNENMGCAALTYSLIRLLETISRERGETFVYHIFEGRPDTARTEKLCAELGVPSERVRCFPVGVLYQRGAMLRHPARYRACIRYIRECALCIDLTQGDSFTDIYGQTRFDRTTDVKLLIERLGVPLILGPQTYGPFQNPANLEKAKKAIRGAACVMSRDRLSADYIADLTDQPVHVVTDLAFALPYQRLGKPADGVCVGLNVSSLLLRDKTESTSVEFEMQCDYDRYIELLLERLTADPRFHVFAIPHVGEDGGAQFRDRFPNVTFLSAFASPTEAKSFISSMDVFIGARMHATVAAYSSGVATIPTAYSRKFAGLYQNLGYDHIVDLQALSAEEAVERTMELVSRRVELCAEIEQGKETMMENVNGIRRVLSDAVWQAADSK